MIATRLTAKSTCLTRPAPPRPLAFARRFQPESEGIAGERQAITLRPSAFPRALESFLETPASIERRFDVHREGGVH